MKKFLPILLGSDANVYGMAKSFHEAYGVKSKAFGKGNLIETRNSKIVDVTMTPGFENNDVFLKKMLEIGRIYKKDYEFLFLISCGDGYTSLVINNKEVLSKYFIIPYINEGLRKKLEEKEAFYETCKKYNLDFPDTYVCTYENKDNINISFDFPVAVKASDSISYLNSSFIGKKKGYKAESKEELNKIINAVYSSTYRGNLIIQDFIPGDDSTMWVLNSYSNKDGLVKMMCLGNCVLEDYTPYGIGNYNAIISSYNKDIYDKMKAFLEAIKYTGFSNFDMKYDQRDGKYKLFEINIRQGRSSYFSTACGCNLAKCLVEDYVENKKKNTVYNKKEGLWLAVPKIILKKYVNKDCMIIDNK
ncbi:MAG: ATP-grasp domain-containing protein [Bacilli bacterium]